MVIQNSKFKIQNSERAFALLFAMFVSSIMLSIGLGISNVIYKELILSGIGRESEISFYNAQTGLECALELDKTNPGLYATASADGTVPTPADQCDGTGLSNYLYSRDPTAGATTTFQVSISYTPNPPMCTSVTVYKAAANYITVESRGYNTPSCPVTDTGTNSRRVERSLKLRTNIVPTDGS